MNKIDFTQTGGFPLTQDTMDFLQKSYQNPLGGLAKFIGSNALCVIDGCVVSGTTMTSGWIAYNGEILPFNGGTVQAAFLVRDVTQNLVYEDGTPHAVVHTRYAEFGVGVGAITWNPARLATPLFTALVNSENHIATGGHDWSKITNTPFVHHGIYDAVNIYNGTPGSGERYDTINIPNIPLPYMVLGTLESYSASGLATDNAVTWAVANLTTTHFDVGFRDNYTLRGDLNGGATRIKLHYVIFKF